LDFDIIKIVLVLDISHIVEFDIKIIVLVIEKNKNHKSSFGNSYKVIYLQDLQIQSIFSPQSNTSQVIPLFTAIALHHVTIGLRHIKGGYSKVLFPALERTNTSLLLSSSC